MIVFNGEVSGECRKFLLQTHKKGLFLVLLIATFVMTIPTAFIAIAWNSHAAWVIVTYSIIPFFAFFPLDKQTKKIVISKKIYIDLEDNMIIRECGDTEKFRSIDCVKKVIDYGDWYHFVFYLGHKDVYFVCQKDKLTKDDLQKFEALFVNEIEKREPKK